MSITKDTFDLLVAAHQGVSPNLEAPLAVQLQKNGLISKDGKITQQGLEALAPYKVDNAVIMAAGLSSRFVPLTYDTPKGLLRVKGEVLIERQIEQLQAAGIEAIYVVVGYKREQFFYLAEKYNVHIIVSKDFAVRNNSSSIWAAKDILANTYICSSDNYYDENPYHAFEYQPNYLLQYSSEPLDEWFVEVDEAALITSAQQEIKTGWYMVGYAYFDRAFSQKYVEILKRQYNHPRTTGMLWEDIYKEHMYELNMYATKQERSIAHEFDSLPELVAFDPDFMETVESPVFTTICKALGCKQHEIFDVYALTESLTNFSCHFATPEGEYVYRHPGIGTEAIVNRQNEYEALKLAQKLGLDATFITADPHAGWKISRFVPHATTIDVHTEEGLKQALDVCKKLHASGAELASEFDFYPVSRDYKRVLDERSYQLSPEDQEIDNELEELYAYFSKDSALRSINHNDFFYNNFLVEQDGTFNLIDWEYAGMGDDTNDIASFTVSSELTPDEVDKAIDYYYDGKVTPQQKRHVYANIGLAGWAWYLWGLIKELDHDNISEWLYIYYKYGKEYIKKALKAYRQSEKERS